MEDTTKNLSFQDCISAVETFHDAFGIPNENAPKAQVGEDTYYLRYKLMREENEE